MAKKNARGKRKCANKIAYGSLEKAKSVAFKIRRRDQKIVFAYSCKFCGSYHLGHRLSSLRRPHLAGVR